MLLNDFSLNLETFNQRKQRIHFFFVYYAIFIAETDKMSKKRVPMGLQRKVDNFIKMVMVNMSENPEKLNHDSLDIPWEVPWKSSTALGGKQVFIGHFIANP